MGYVTLKDHTNSTLPSKKDCRLYGKESEDSLCPVLSLVKKGDIDSRTVSQN